MITGVLRRSFPFLALLALCVQSYAAGPPWTTERLIDALADPGEDDQRFGPLMGGRGFVLVAPAETEQPRYGSRRDSIRLEAMQELVRRGPRAVPNLIAHLGDTRRTPIVVGPAGLLDTIHLDTRADRNLRTQRADRRGRTRDSVHQATGRHGGRPLLRRAGSNRES